MRTAHSRLAAGVTRYQNRCQKNRRRTGVHRGVGPPLLPVWARDLIGPTPMHYRRRGHGYDHDRLLVSIL